MQVFKKLLFLLNTNERKRAGLLLVMIIIMSLLDMLGVVSILPFMAVLTNPNLIESNLILSKIFYYSTLFGIEDSREFLFFLGVIVFILLIISLAFKAITIYAQVRFILMREYSIGKRLIEGYLHQPYSWFLDRHSADLGKTILSEVSAIIGNGLKPLIEMISHSLVTFMLIVLLIIIDPILTLLVTISFSLVYGLIFFFISNYLKQIGKKRLDNNQLRFTTVNEAFGAVKEIKVSGKEESYINIFSNAAKIFARTQASLSLVIQLPRFFLEAIAFGGIMLIILYLMRLTGSFNNALPVISVYVFAGYRMIPALQNIYQSFTKLAFVAPSLDKLHNDLQSLELKSINQNQEDFTINNSINLNEIYYNYPNSSQTAISNMNLIIPAKSTVGLIGLTGSGKTTTVDIILGLLEPQKGTLKIDGKIITKKNVRSWQQSIGYVPQTIFLIDDTIASNIAFGVDPKKIDQDLIEKVSKIANLHNFVTNELPKKYETKIGERGLKLSGGQRQRIGIARALYHKPQALILDEATSALDNETEEIVMKAVKNLSKNLTIIIIAHRLNTLKGCDVVYKLDKGRLIDNGSFNKIKK